MECFLNANTWTISLSAAPNAYTYMYICRPLRQWRGLHVEKGTLSRTF